MLSTQAAQEASNAGVIGQAEFEERIHRILPPPEGGSALALPEVSAPGSKNEPAKWPSGDLEGITRKPYIPMLEEQNVRSGFFEQSQFEKLLAELPAWLRPPMTFAYLTWQERQAHFRDCPYIFHRNGKRIRYPYCRVAERLQKSGVGG